MLKVNVICIGRLKEKYLTDACAEYIKRLSAFCSLHVCELPEAKVSSTPSASDIEKVLYEEGKAIVSKIPERSAVISMCIEGQKMSSEQLSRHISSLGVSGFGSVTFIIGGSWGLSDEVKAKSDLRLSMSDMTFPHQLARVMLLEQIYRAFMIASGGKYHK